MITIAEETPFEAGAREALLDRAFGPGRFQKTSERLREGRLPAQGLSLVARDDEAAGEGTGLLGTGLLGTGLLGTVRLWHVAAGAGRPALLLGPLAVEPSRQCDGIGGALMRAAIARAAAAGHAAILLVGDAPYYERFGFSADKTGLLWLPGPYVRERFLALELATGSLDGARGLVSATGERRPVPDLATLVARAAAELPLAA
jgi:predicted N-acetyltransferase YhbS